MFLLRIANTFVVIYMRGAMAIVFACLFVKIDNFIN